jgi:hypothetical protein
MMKKLAAGLTLWVTTTGAAFAIFSAPSDATVPEPSIGVLLVAGALVAGGLRYIGKRNK